MAGTRGRRDRLIKERHHDVYRNTEKLPEPAICTRCHALFAGGRWSWEETSEKANPTVCPACRRSADNYPAGLVEMKGEFFDAHRTEILNLVANIESQEKGERPLERIMTIADNEDHTVVATTGIHIARRIGEALSRSYKGDYSFQYADGDKNIRVYWQR